MARIEYKGSGVYNVLSSTGVFIINESDEHTAQMLTDFLSDPLSLDRWEQVCAAHGTDAYYVYNNLEIPVYDEDAE